MPDPDLSILIEIPTGSAIEPLITPVRDNKCPLEIQFERLTKVAPKNAMILLAGSEPSHKPFGKLAALHGLFLIRISETVNFKRLVHAASSRRTKTLVRVSAAHTFADPDILLGMLELHRKQKTAYTFLEGVPDWLGGEIFERAELIDAFVAADMVGRAEDQPGVFFRSRKETFQTAKYQPKIRGRWKNIELSLENPASAALTIETIRRSPNPATVSYTDFLG
jgi:spore coat polysaccharide biosynthesis protein SpsF (cytidylyltransferase family)